MYTIYSCFCFFFFILGAVQRKYESMRRQWVLDGKEGKDEVTFQEALRKKYRARRQRVCCVHYY